MCSNCCGHSASFEYGEKLQLTLKKRAKNLVFRGFMVFSPKEKHNLGKNIDSYFITNYDGSIGF